MKNMKNMIAMSIGTAVGLVVFVVLFADFNVTLISLVAVILFAISIVAVISAIYVNSMIDLLYIGVIFILSFSILVLCFLNINEILVFVLRGIAVSLSTYMVTYLLSSNEN